MSAGGGGPRGASLIVVTAAASAWTSSLALRRWPPGGAARWSRVNHRDEPVTLLEGPAFALAAVVSLLVPLAPARLRAAGAVAVLGAAAVGGYDDLAGDGGSKGLRGHLGALARGQVTTGAVKVLGLAMTGVAAAAVSGPAALGGARWSSGQAAEVGPGGVVVDVLVDGAVIAGLANLVNLLDLRPGRALKVVLFCASLVPGAGRPLAAAAAGAAVGLLGEDLAERSMLGDTGAAAAGALLGTAVVVAVDRRTRWVVLGVLCALTLASEKVSFTRVIEATLGLRELDRLGRRPARPPS